MLVLVSVLTKEWVTCHLLVLILTQEWVTCHVGFDFDLEMGGMLVLVSVLT